MAVYITCLNGMMTISVPQQVQCHTAKVAYQMGCREMGIYYYNANAESIESRRSRFDGMIAGISAGDVVICQFPTWNGLSFISNIVRAY